MATARGARPASDYVVGEFWRHRRTGGLVSIKRIEPPMPGDAETYVVLQLPEGGVRDAIGSDLLEQVAVASQTQPSPSAPPTTTTTVLSPEAASERMLASMQQPTTNAVTLETEGSLAFARKWMQGKMSKGKWPGWATLVKGPTETLAGFHCQLCHDHAPLGANGKRTG